MTTVPQGELFRAHAHTHGQAERQISRKRRDNTATLKPTTPLHTHNKGPVKPTSPLRPKTPPKMPISHPQRRWRFQPHAGTSEQRRRWFHPTQTPTSKGDDGFKPPGHLADRARTRRPRAAAEPNRATGGRPTLQTSSNQRNLNRPTRTSVTNVVNLSQKTTIFSQRAIRLTTFVTTD